MDVQQLLCARLVQPSFETADPRTPRAAVALEKLGCLARRDEMAVPGVLSSALEALVVELPSQPQQRVIRVGTSESVRP